MNDTEKASARSRSRTSPEDPPAGSAAASPIAAVRRARPAATGTLGKAGSDTHAHDLGTMTGEAPMGQPGAAAGSPPGTSDRSNPRRPR